MKLLRFVWVDSSAAADEWLCKHDVEVMEPIECISVGWLVNSTKKVIKLAGDKGNDKFHRIIIIPKGCIISRTTLEEIK